MRSGKVSRIGLAVLLCGWMAEAAAGQTAATPAPSATTQLELDAAMEPLVALRDDFVAKAKTDGFACTLAPPKIELTAVASFGNYDQETNTLRTPVWTQLSEQERALFFRLAGPGADELAAHRVFERGTHHWVFVHEMGHWWQFCSGGMKNLSHWDVEYGANRIAAAYWREENPSLMATLAMGFQRMLEAQNPVPAGQNVEEYFNTHYEELAKTPAYPWFQAAMIAKVNAETPAPTFKEALADAKKGASGEAKK